MIIFVSASDYPCFLLAFFLHFDWLDRNLGEGKERVLSFIIMLFWVLLKTQELVLVTSEMKSLFRASKRGCFCFS